MELKMQTYNIPEAIGFNYQELKNELTEKVSMYETLVYCEEQVNEAKKDKANLNKLKKALNDERIRLQKEYMQPFNDFKEKIDELISIIEKPVALIDKHVKEYEEVQKQEKTAKIDELLKEAEKELPEEVHIPFDKDWLNKSTSMKSIEGEIKVWVEQINEALATLKNLPEYAFEATEVYKSSLNLNAALNEAHRLSEMAKKKAEAEKKVQEEQAMLVEEASKARIVKPEVEPQKDEEFIPPVVDEEFEKQAFASITKEELVKEWVSFKCLLTVEDAQALGQFFKSRNISYEQI